jgi:fatty-acyl-CoA synthase
MCRNHRGFIEATVACCKLAADILYLDPEAGSAALAETVRRENPRLLIYDEEFSELLRPLGHGRKRLIAWCDADRAPRHPLLEELIANAGPVTLRAAKRQTHSTVTLACPGATGTDRTPHRLPGSLLTPGAVCSRIPLRPRETTMIAAPMFDPCGFLHLTLALRLTSTLVLHREFDPVEALAALDRHKITAIALLPEMLARIMELPKETLAWYQTDALRVIAPKGPALPGELAIAAMARFGNVLYNLRGHTVIRLETGWPWPTPSIGQTAHAVAAVRPAPSRPSTLTTVRQPTMQGEST